MAIANLDQLINGMANSSQRFWFDKTSVANAVAYQIFSLFGVANIPRGGANPTTAAICTSALQGSFPFTNSSGSNKLHVVGMNVVNTSGAFQLWLMDRLGHMGGLSGTSTSGQTVDLDLNTSSNNIPARIGASNYSEVLWYLEWYSDTGATASNATVNVTYNDGSTGNLAVVAVGGTVRARRMIPLVPATDGLYIREVNTVTLSASTGTAGNFGVTAYRRLSACNAVVANAGGTVGWDETNLAVVEDDACLTLACIAPTTSTGQIYGSITLAEG